MKHPRFRLKHRGLAVATALLLTTSAALAVYESAPAASKRSTVIAAPAPVIEDLPQHREPPPPPPPPPPKPKPKPKPRPRARAAPAAANVDVYRGLGAWVDIYDEMLDVSASVDEMSARGVKTLYLETNNWRSRGNGSCEPGPDVDILYPDIVANFLDRAHAKGIRVVAWYLPGFANIDRDLKRSLAAINFSSPAGNHFDGFAADIETRGEFGCQGVTGDEVRTRFNAGIIDYSTRLRQAVGDKVLGAIVVDAKNNERAPARWEGFPWPEIAKRYDIVMPMAYWTADPANGDPANKCPGVDVDTSSYMQQVVEKTRALMGTSKPMHVVGGVADCVTAAETAGYVGAMKALGSVGVSLYDFRTIQGHPDKELLWAELGRFG